MFDSRTGIQVFDWYPNEFLGDVEVFWATGGCCWAVINSEGERGFSAQINNAGKSWVGYQSVQFQDFWWVKQGVCIVSPILCENIWILKPHDLNCLKNSDGCFDSDHNHDSFGFYDCKEVAYNHNYGSLMTMIVASKIGTTMVVYITITFPVMAGLVLRVIML